MPEIRLDEIQRAPVKDELTDIKAPEAQRLDDVVGTRVRDPKNTILKLNSQEREAISKIPTRSKDQPFGLTESQRNTLTEMRQRGEEIGFFEGIGRSEGFKDLKNLIALGTATKTPFLSREVGAQAISDLSVVNAVTTKIAIDRFVENEYEDKFFIDKDGDKILTETAASRKQQDIDTVNAFLFKFEEERIRGVTTLGKIGAGVGELPLFMLEFLASGSAATGIRKGATTLVKKEVTKQVKKSIKRRIMEGTLDLTTQAALQTGLTPHRVVGGAAKRQIFSQLELTERGFQLRNEATETPFISFAKALGDHFIEMVSEGSGRALVVAPGVAKEIAVKALPKKVVGFSTAATVKAKAAVSRFGQNFPGKKFIPVKVAEAFEKAFILMKPGVNPNNLWTKSGFNGFIAEIGEERIGGILRAVTGVEDFGAGDNANILDKIIASFPNSEEMLVEMGVIAFPAVGAKLSNPQLVQHLQDLRKKEPGGIPEAEELKDVSEAQFRELLGDLIPEEVPEAEAVVEEVPEAEVVEKKPVKEKIPEAEVIEKKTKAEISKERKLIIEGRVDELSRQSDQVLKDIDTLEKEKSALEAQDKSTTQIDSRIEKLTEKFDRLDEEIATIRTQPGEVTGISPGARIVTTPARVLSAIKTRVKQTIAFTKAEIRSVQDEIVTQIRRFELEDKAQAQLLERVRKTQTPKQLETNLPKFIEAARKAAEKSSKRRLMKQLDKALKLTKPTKAGAKPVGKFTPEFQKKFDKIREFVKLDREQVGNRLENNLEKIDDPKTTPDERLELLLDNRLLAGVGALGTKSVEELENLNDALRADIKSGRDIARDKLKRKKAEREQKVSDSLDTLGLIERTAKKDSLFKAFKKRLSTFGRGITGFQDIIDMLSIGDKKSKAFESKLSQHTDVTKIEQLEKKLVMENTQKAVNMGLKAFNLKTDKQFLKQLDRDSVIKDFGIFTDASGVDIRLSLDKQDIRKVWMEMQDPLIKEVLEDSKGGYVIDTIEVHGFTEEMQDAIFSTLTTEDKAFAEAQFGFYSDLYDSINKQFKEDNNIDLPFNELYSPIRRQLSQQRTTDTFLEEQGFRRSIDPAFLKTRVQNFESIRMQSDWTALQSHIVEMGHYIAWSTKLKDLNAIFGSSTVRNTIKNKFGDGPLKLIDEFIEDFKNRGANKSKQIEGFLNQLRINFTVSAIALKPAIFLKQLSSIPAYAEFIPTKAFVGGMLDFFKNPAKNWETLNKVSPLFATRSAHQDRDLKDAADSVEFARFKKVQSLKNMIMFLTRWGDKTAIAVGGWAVYKHTLDTTGSKKKATEAFEKATASTQQSADISQLSAWQRGGGFAKLFTMFTSAQNQYFRRELSAWRNALADPKAFIKGEGRISRGDFVKKVAIYHFILPMMFQWISDFGEWDEDEQKRAATLGSLNGIFILGDILDSAIRIFLNATADADLPTFTNSAGNTPVFDIKDDILKGLGKLTTDDISAEEFLDGVKDLSEGVVGPLTGIPFKRLFDSYEGIDDIIDDDEIAKGILKLMGWSPYTVDKKLGAKSKGFKF